MTDVFVVSGIPLVRALKKHDLKMGRDFTTEKGAAHRQNQIKLRFKDRNKALMFKLTYGGGDA